MGVYVPMVLMLVLAVIAGPQAKKEFKVDIYSNQQLKQTIVVRRDRGGFSGFNGKEEIMRITPIKDRRNAYQWTESGGGLEIDFSRYIASFDLRNVLAAQSADLKISPELVLHLRREAGALYIKMGPVKIEGTEEPQELMYVAQ